MAKSPESFSSLIHITGGYALRDYGEKELQYGFFLNGGDQPALVNEDLVLSSAASSAPGHIAAMYALQADRAAKGDTDFLAEIDRELAEEDCDSEEWVLKMFNRLGKLPVTAGLDTPKELLPYFSCCFINENRFFVQTMGDVCAFFLYNGAMYPLVRNGLKIEGVDVNGVPLADFYAFCDTDIGHGHYSRPVNILEGASVVLAKLEVFEALGQKHFTEICSSDETAFEIAKKLVDEAFALRDDVSHQAMIIKFVNEYDVADYPFTYEKLKRDKRFSQLSTFASAGIRENVRENEGVSNFMDKGRGPDNRDRDSRYKPQRQREEKISRHSEESLDDYSRKEGDTGKFTSPEVYEGTIDYRYEAGPDEMFEPKYTEDKTVKFSKSSLRTGVDSVSGRVAEVHAEGGEEGETRKFAAPVSILDSAAARSEKVHETREIDNDEARAGFSVRKSSTDQIDDFAEAHDDGLDFEPRNHEEEQAFDDYAVGGDAYEDYNQPVDADGAYQDDYVDNYQSDYQEDYDYGDGYYDDQGYGDEYGDAYYDDGDYAYDSYAEGDGYADDYYADGYGDGYYDDYYDDGYADDGYGGYDDSYSSYDAYDNYGSDYKYSKDAGLRPGDFKGGPAMLEADKRRSKKTVPIISAIVSIICFIAILYMFGAFGNKDKDKDKAEKGNDERRGNEIESREMRERESEEGTPAPPGPGVIIDDNEESQPQDNQDHNEEQEARKTEPANDDNQSADDGEQPVEGESYIWISEEGEDIFDMAKMFYGSSAPKYVRVLREANPEVFAGGDIPQVGVKVIQPLMKSAPYYGKSQEEIVAINESGGAEGNASQFQEGANEPAEVPQEQGAEEQPQGNNDVNDQEQPQADNALPLEPQTDKDAAIVPQEEHVAAAAQAVENSELQNCQAGSAADSEGAAEDAPVFA